MKTAVVTGANGGIGYHTALQLAKSGSRVILACRNQMKGREAILRIMAEAPDAKVELSILDLSSLDSVRKFAGRLAETESSIDLLVNNAAIMAVPERTLSKDGYELQFATNHLGHFALTGEVLPLLLNSAAPRVVTVSSIAHRYGKLDLNDLQSEKSYEGWTAYGSSKLANLLFTYEMARLSKAAASPLLCLAAHPGVAKTNILANGPRMGRKVLRTFASEFFAQIFAQTDAEGALPIIYACTNENVQSGDYFGPDGFMQLRGNATKVQSNAQSHDLHLAKELWSSSQLLTNTKYAFN